MQITFEPQGTGTPRPEDRLPVYTTYNGDTTTFDGLFKLEDDTPVSYENSNLTFTIRDHRFHLDTIWMGTWRDGIELVNATDHPGLVRVRIPDDISASLRRGSYIFSLLVENKKTKFKKTEMQGMLQIEYAPTSDIHDIPYR